MEQLAQFEAQASAAALPSECRAQLSEQKGMLNRFAAPGERPLAFVRRHRGLAPDANGVVRRTRSPRRSACPIGPMQRRTAPSGQLPERSAGLLAELEAGIQRESKRHLKQQEERIRLMKDTLALLGPAPH